MARPRLPTPAPTLPPQLPHRQNRRTGRTILATPQNPALSRDPSQPSGKGGGGGGKGRRRSHAYPHHPPQAQTCSHHHHHHYHHHHHHHHHHLCHHQYHHPSHVKGSTTRHRASFRSYGRLALICIRLCKLSLQSLEDERGEFLSVLQVLDDFGTAIDRRGLFFDPDDFTANTQDHLPLEAKRVLQMKASARTDRDIAYLLIVLRNIPAFAEYPTRMQRMLCAVAWYESYEPRRAIIREGHPPHSFYFILSGTVLVTRFEAQSGSSRTLVSLQQGMSFGELAVITGSRRQATVSTKTFVELLCISAWDFEDIFMSGGMKTITDPDHNSFLRSVAFLKHWPLHCLADQPQHCMFHYFNRGQVLVRDSNNSDWIYIVKSGSLSVLKKLQHAQAHSNNHSKDTPPPEGGDVSTGHGKDSRELGKSFGTWRHRLPRHAPRRRKERKRTSSPEVFRNQLEADRRLEQTLPGLFNTADRLGTVDYDRVIRHYRARVLPKPGSEPPPLRLPPISTHPPRATSGLELHADRTEAEEDGDSTSHPAKEEVEEEEVREEGGWEEVEESRPISKTSKGVYLAASPTRRRRKKGERPAEVDVTSKRKEEVTSSEVSTEDTQDSVADMLNSLNVDYQRRFREHVGRKTMADQLDHKGSRDFRYREVDLNPMFVLLQVLERGQYFGVSQLLYRDQPSLCVVSNGAELIVLSKKLFMDRASEACLRHITHTESPYPAEEALQKRLQNYVDWQAHRGAVYRRLVSDIRQRQARRKQFLPSIPGQYCFRSGPL